MAFLLLSAFTADDIQSGANRLRKLKIGLEANGENCKWLGPEGGFVVNGGWRKIAASWRLFSSAFRWGREKRDNYVVISLPPPWILVPAFALALIIPEQLVVDYRDPIFNQQINPRSYLYRTILGFMEWFLNSRARLIIVAAPRISSHVSPSRRKPVTVLAGLDEKELEVTRSSGKARDLKKVIYGGTFYGSRSPGLLLEAISKESSELRFEFYVSFNDAAEENSTKSQVSGLGLSSRVSFHSQVPRTEFLEILRGAAAGLIITHAEGSDYAIPGKIFDYLSTGVLPWVISRDAGLLELLRDHSLKASITEGWTEAQLRSGIRQLAAKLSSDCSLGFEVEKLSVTRQARILVEKLRE